MPKLEVAATNLTTSASVQQPLRRARRTTPRPSFGFGSLRWDVAGRPTGLPLPPRKLCGPSAGPAGCELEDKSDGASNTHAFDALGPDAAATPRAAALARTASAFFAACSILALAAAVGIMNLPPGGLISLPRSSRGAHSSPIFRRLPLITSYHSIDRHFLLSTPCFSVSVVKWPALPGGGLNEGFEAYHGSKSFLFKVRRAAVSFSTETTRPAGGPVRGPVPAQAEELVSSSVKAAMPSVGWTTSAVEVAAADISSESMRQAASPDHVG